ncbi:hypothetical protein PIROE2DRAFT_59246 [Piromyces sp. E2]|nr:hypothetical protein PIROE2DRAFT_59246 [Piromyces sp. E2]|eukprot:OUM66656.1 hypothetical protein PIROE2DRAFT_59246 [Piromyces sp. E2]
MEFIDNNYYKLLFNENDEELELFKRSPKSKKKYSKYYKTKNYSTSKNKSSGSTIGIIIGVIILIVVLIVICIWGIGKKRKRSNTVGVENPEESNELNYVTVDNNYNNPQNPYPQDTYMQNTYPQPYNPVPNLTELGTGEPINSDNITSMPQPKEIVGEKGDFNKTNPIGEENTSNINPMPAMPAMPSSPPIPNLTNMETNEIITESNEIPNMPQPK